jgi:hypothetical protein
MIMVELRIVGLEESVVAMVEPITGRNRKGAAES